MYPEYGATAHAGEARGESPASAVNVAHVVYGLHAFALLSGLLGSATVIGSFIASVPSIVAVVLNYVNRRAAAGSWVESHYRWQIRTFWFALLWFASFWFLLVTLIGIPIALLVGFGLPIWLFYRIARGWRRLASRRSMYA
jgi:uncharacterized membrane protein